MPHVDGFALLAALRADPRTCSLPVVFVGDRTGAEARVEGSIANPDDYVARPLAAPQLVARVRNHIARSHIQRAWAIERERVGQELARRDPGARQMTTLDVTALSQVEHCELRQESIDLTEIVRGIAAELRARETMAPNSTHSINRTLSRAPGST
jgi:DNA-binding response OmpR family regulator